MELNVKKDLELKVDLQETVLEELRNRKRIDAVGEPYRDINKWYCCCGEDNWINNGV